MVASTKSSSGSDKSNSLPRTAQETPPAGTLGEPPSPLHLPHAEPPREEQAPELPTPPAVVLAQPSQNGEPVPVVDPCAVSQPVPLAPIVPQDVPQVMCPPPPPAAAAAPPAPAPAASTVPVAPPRRRRRNRLNTDDVSAFDVFCVCMLVSASISIMKKISIYLISSEERCQTNAKIFCLPSLCSILNGGGKGVPIFKANAILRKLDFKSKRIFIFVFNQDSSDCKTLKYTVDHI